MKLFAASLFMVLFSIGYVQAENFSYSFTCNTASDTTGPCTVDGEGDTIELATAAAKALAFCNSPDNSVAENAYTTYACGECADDAVGTCKSCPAYVDEVAANNCNAPIILDWECYTSEAKVNCTGQTVACFGPSDTFNATAPDANAALKAGGGCGACDASYAAADCTTCDTTLCNNAVRVASIMGPLLALLFWVH